MHSHRVKILYRANNDDVVVEVAHDLKLVFLPAEDGFFDKDLRIWRGSKAAFRNCLEFVRIIGRAAARAAQRKRRPDDRGVTDLIDDFFGLFPGVGKSTSWTLNADLVHRGLKKLTVL